jgi:hypothetical protein
MDFDSVAPMVFTGLFALVFVTVLIRSVKHGGLKGWLFGARIVRTHGEVSGTGGKPMTTVLKVHTLAGAGPEKAVGIEFVARSFASYQMMPFSLSVAETKKLISLLESAVHGR